MMAATRRRGLDTTDHVIQPFSKELEWLPGKVPPHFGDGTGNSESLPRGGGTNVVSSEGGPFEPFKSAWLLRGWQCRGAARADVIDFRSPTRPFGVQPFSIPAP